MNASPDQDRARCAFDADRARIYREQFDEQVIVTSGSYRHYGDGIERISASFGRPIVALDLGCGTGRHFSCLRNVSHLVGIDVSEHMIEQARRPVLAERITVGSIELRVGDAFSEVLEPS
ncbi:MAG: class I SAM-dependent methyltransferase, partial [Gammaproteobacteria bacterium]|nr:class I SAM-dependent methyltransferase [Gammaproteobacteria bacterium]